MPFDGTSIIGVPKQSAAVAEGAIGSISGVKQRQLPVWVLSKGPECNQATLAVLAWARQLLIDEQRWCKRSFARSWFDIPVPSGSAWARRFCALGAIMRAGRELGLPIEDARRVLEWQTIIPVADWNDDAQRTHAEVIEAFDAAIAAFDQAAA
jgi:hypothetical protein